MAPSRRTIAYEEPAHFAANSISRRLRATVSSESYCLLKETEFSR